MSELAYANHFTDLVVWRKSRTLAREVFHVTKEFPEEERYSLTDQIRRSSRSIGAQIAEAWAKRRYEEHFISKLTDADGEQNETQHWLIEAMDAHYLSKEKTCELGTSCKEIGAMLGKMIACSSQFCRDQNKESAVQHEPDPISEFIALTPIGPEWLNQQTFVKTEN